MATETIKLKDIVRDPRLQLRVKGLDKHHVAELVDALKSGKKLGAIKACRKGKKVFPYDGWHRIAAHEQAEKETIDASLDDGDIEQAVLLAAGANSTHGLKRTNDDKRASVMAVLSHSAGREWSDRRIADHVGVGVDLVGDCRRSQVSDSDTCQEETEEKTVLGRDGKKYKRKPKTSKSSTKEESSNAETEPNGVDHSANCATTNGVVSEPANDTDNPFPKEAEEMQSLGRELYRLAGLVKAASEKIAVLDGPSFTPFVMKENMTIQLDNIVSSLKSHANNLKISSPAGTCLECKGRGCAACGHRRWQTVEERAISENRRKATTKLRNGAVA
jgi:hypothetical protein